MPIFIQHIHNVFQPNEIGGGVKNVKPFIKIVPYTK